ncbi:MAG: hypothetical protein MJ181_10800 [Treponema sp.]|nr:hypothetical protein [Treponema sp.]
MNITEILNNYLLEHSLKDKVEFIFNDLFPFDDGDCLISRIEPSSAQETSFIDGSCVGSVTLAYYMRSQNAEVCRNILNAICDEVDNLALTDGNETEVRFESQTLPSFVSEDEKGLVIYSSVIVAKYNRKGE